MIIYIIFLAYSFGVVASDHAARLEDLKTKLHETNTEESQHKEIDNFFGKLLNEFNVNGLELRVVTERLEEKNKGMITLYLDDIKKPVSLIGFTWCDDSKLSIDYSYTMDGVAHKGKYNCLGCGFNTYLRGILIIWSYLRNAGCKSEPISLITNYNFAKFGVSSGSLTFDWDTLMWSIKFSLPSKTALEQISELIDKIKLNLNSKESMYTASGIFTTQEYIKKKVLEKYPDIENKWSPMWDRIMSFKNYPIGPHHTHEKHPCKPGKEKHPLQFEVDEALALNALRVIIESLQKKRAPPTPVTPTESSCG